MRVILVGRDESRLAQTAAWIAAQGAPVPPQTIRADLSLLVETRQAAERIASMTASLELLVTNAGTLSPHRVETVEGHELTLAVNHLSPFVLTRALLPLLRASGAGRVVATGSSTSDHAGIDPDDLEMARRWRMTRAYARSKLALLMTATEIARQEQGRGVSVNVVHPGLVATDLVRSGGIDQFVWSRVLSRIALDARAGADCTLFAALSPDLAETTGCYLKRRRPARPNRRVLDPALRARVLAATERLVGD